MPPLGETRFLTVQPGQECVLFAVATPVKADCAVTGMGGGTGSRLEATADGTAVGPLANPGDSVVVQARVLRLKAVGTWFMVAYSVEGFGTPAPPAPPSGPAPAPAPAPAPPPPTKVEAKILNTQASVKGTGGIIVEIKCLAVVSPPAALPGKAYLVIAEFDAKGNSFKRDLIFHFSDAPASFELQTDSMSPGWSATAALVVTARDGTTATTTFSLAVTA